MFNGVGEKNIKRAEILVQALPYIQEFYGKTIVVKYGGNAMINDELKNSVIKDIVMLNCVGIKVVVVHGGGPEINNMLNKIGKEGKFINGLRVTDRETIDIVQMVLAGKVNKDIVALINQMGGKAVGLSGIDGNLLTAEKLEKNDGVDLGYVGEICNVDESIIEHNLNGGYIPVISTVALNKTDGQVYNINADYAAAKISVKLNAEKLILLTDVPGILEDINEPESLLAEVNLNDINRLKKKGVINGGMLPKVDCCLEAVQGGVDKAHIIDGRLSHSLLLELLSQEGVGTMITSESL
ncbi:acetylglutamate kinase [Clostridium magnum]|uniref:Acetylglutamate kinase n=1 Tax=Clostridium magnum DSM 2767 TaxID=1121326 RepID=A0A162RYJ4_9CLOT|nr:acetylglutamate kinase [Clostridium magnum]KZL90550.1 acetylglutamate kinase [Clostridium magnum DSM 2767]SHI04915.1 N-acetylglutamate kinase [Clostridium magnum DSM 2767]